MAALVSRLARMALFLRHSGIPLGMVKTAVLRLGVRLVVWLRVSVWCAIRLGPSVLNIGPVLRIVRTVGAVNRLKFRDLCKASSLVIRLTLLPAISIDCRGSACGLAGRSVGAVVSRVWTLGEVPRTV